MSMRKHMENSEYHNIIIQMLVQVQPYYITYEPLYSLGTDRSTTTDQETPFTYLELFHVCKGFVRSSTVLTSKETARGR